MEKRVISTQIQEEDLKIETSLRPQRLEEYIGQEKAKKTLKIYIEAAKQRGESLDHVLFYGPPGLGKTTLAGIIANEMNVHMKITSGPAIGKPGEMAAILMIHNPKPIPQGGRQKPCSGGGPHQGKMGQIQPDRPGCGSLSNHNVNDIILHSGIENFRSDWIRMTVTSC